MLIAIIQNSEITIYENMESVKIALAKGADIIILRGFEGRYNEIGELFGKIHSYTESLKKRDSRGLVKDSRGLVKDSQGLVNISPAFALENIYSTNANTKLIINALPDERWLKFKPDGFHLNRHNVKIVLEKPELIDMLRNRVELLGTSVHNKEEMMRILLLNEKISVDYLLISPIFKPSYDQKGETLGIDGFRVLYENLIEACNKANISRPRAISLGGINKESVRELMRYNFIEGVAVMSAIGDLPDEVLERWREPMYPWSNL
ncbi:MAG: thiamine phosphate synthase [Desulfamplus sp.]|nr:thiamine phosphate synthase [Desulfamplus sp.]